MQIADADQSLNSQKTLHKSPSQARFGMYFVNILEKITNL